jgi:hypothetical protein
MKHADVSSSEKEAYQRNTPQAIAKVYSRPCAPMRRSLRGRDAALARSDAGIRRLDRKNESAAATRALRKGCPMTIPSRGRLRLRRYGGVENGAPLAVRHPPDDGAVAA